MWVTPTVEIHRVLTSNCSLWHECIVWKRSALIRLGGEALGLQDIDVEDDKKNRMCMNP